MLNQQNYQKIKEIKDGQQYKYSEPHYVKKWNGGYISIKVGYVSKHPEENCIVLEKVYPSKFGNKIEKFNIKNGKDWILIKEAIDKLSPEIGKVLSETEIHQAIEQISKETELLELIASYPELLNQIPADLDILTLPSEHKEALKRLLEVGGGVANKVIAQLSKQPISDINKFTELLEELKLSTINSLVTHITSRIAFIDMFEKAILDDSSYERRGIDSIHNRLKTNMWIVDRNYSVLHDDETLKNIIYKDYDKNVQGKDFTVRPDFLCMSNTVDNDPKKIVIIEIKRPTVTIKMEHITQIMKYKMILQKYSGEKISDCICYIVGREIDPLVLNNDLSNSGFIVRTYTDFISRARKFYQEYLKIISEEQGLAF